MERRRKRAVEAITGESLLAVANAVGVHVKSVERWVRMARQPNGLDAKPQPGPTPGLTDAKLERLERLLVKGAKANGWPNELWTAARVARLIERKFGRQYHPEHVRKILKWRLGWTSQKPRRRAREPRQVVGTAALGRPEDVALVLDQHRRRLAFRRDPDRH